MILLLLALLIATPILAETPASRTDDVLGIYFDEDASTSCFETSVAYEEVVAHVIVRHMSHSVLEGYALGITLEGEEGLFSLTVDNVACAYDVLEGLEFMTAGCEVQVETNVVLLTLHATVIHPDATVYFYLRAIPERMLNPFPECVDAPCYYGEVGDVFSFNPSSGSWNLPVAAINAGELCVNVPAQEMSWSGVKALYR